MTEKLNSRVVVISQARMTSTRLPGKILHTIGGKTLLQYHLDRLDHPNWDLMVATTLNQQDDAVESLCRSLRIAFSRGSESNVLERYCNAAQLTEANIIIRVTSDCPFIDASLIDRGLQEFISDQRKRKYLSNCFPRTYARGFDFEIFDREILFEALAKSDDPLDVEHVTPYMWKNKPGDIVLLNNAQVADHSALRICVDTSEDLELASLLIEEYGCENKTYAEIENLLLEHPELVSINAHIEQKKS